jgi:uncharacterized NAD-dependent epimerase/dehydratase family protein
VQVGSINRVNCNNVACNVQNPVNPAYFCRMEYSNKAVIITASLLHTSNAKTAHGLIRGSERFRIVGVIDEYNQGKDAGAVLDGNERGIPVYADIAAAKAQHPDLGYCIIGVATSGGILPDAMVAEVRTAIEAGVSVVNGLHDYLNERPDLVALAQQHQVELLDVRRPKKRADLHFWSGAIYDVKAPIIALLGMDCNMGKRTTTRFLMEACQSEGLNAQMIYTGQTGWLQGGKYGFIFDSTLNDFISGEMEHAIVSCYQETNADLILLEGQSSLRNPSGPCGSEYLVSANAKLVILVHAPKRTYFHDEPDWGPIPSVESEIKLIEMYGSKVIALALNTGGCTRDEAFAYQKQYEADLGIPVLLPLEEGVEKVVPLLRDIGK